VILGPNRTDLLQWIWWSTVGHAAVAVLNNDLYFIPDISKSHLNSKRLTFDGLFNTIYNGVTDRIYKGETIFKLSKKRFLSSLTNFFTL